MDKTILVIGATGMLGEPVARCLKEDGFKVRVMTRDANKARKDVAVCGEMASQPEHIMLLLGMGVRTISLTPPMIPEIKRGNQLVAPVNS